MCSVFVTGADRIANFYDIERLARLPGRVIHNLTLSSNDFADYLLASFNPRLMIGINVDERRVKSGNPLKHGEQCSYSKFRCFFNDNGNRFMTFFSQIVPGSKIKSMQIISSGCFEFNDQALMVSMFQDFDKDDKDIV